jgi:hypothetical protein
MPPEDVHGSFERLVAVELTGTANRTSRSISYSGSGGHEAISYRQGKDCTKNLYRTGKKG